MAESGKQTLLRQNDRALEKAGITGSKAGNLDVILPQLNHLMQHCSTGDSAEYGDISETLAPEALEAILTFIKGI